MRFHAPAREAVDPAVFRRPPLQAWDADFGAWLNAPNWPAVEAINQAWPSESNFRFVCQDPGLLADGLHYEQRIAEHGCIATRPENWHDLLNAMIWLRYPQLKQALNRQQMLEIGKVGPRQRSRVQCALTHFDEAGAMVWLRDPALLACWDQHDWDGLFWQARDAWHDGRIHCEVFGHAVLEHALAADALLVAKCLVIYAPDPQRPPMLAEQVAQRVMAGQLLRDPQELRPLPLSGIPGWHAGNQQRSFYQQAACFRPLRPGRVYPPPVCLP